MNIRTLITGFCLALALLFGTSQSTQAQCPMCKLSAESNLKSGGQAGKGLNQGILFLLVTPYLMVGTLGYIWYRNRKKSDPADLEGA